MNKPIDSKALDEAIYTLMRDEFQLKESNSFQNVWHGFITLRAYLFSENEMRGLTIKELQLSMIRLKVAGLVEIRPCSAIDFTQFGRGWFIRK